jgi:MFS family permease
MEKNKIKRSLKCSFIDGSFFSVMFGFGDSYFNPYAILLKASNFQIGLLSSLPGLLSSLVQIRTPDWTEKVGRSRIIYWGVLAQVLLWLPIILIPFLFPGNPVPWLIAAVSLYLLSSALAGPAWSSIMSQYLPARSRGRYFSWRQKILSAITVMATFAAGYVLYSFPRQSVFGFTVIFSVAMICRFFSWYFLTRMHEPRLTVKPNARFTLQDFLSRMRTSNFAKFSLFVAAMSFTVNLAGPFFSVYMLRELKFDYLTYVIVNTTPLIAMLLSLTAWGKHTDSAGSMRVISLTSFLIPTLPLMWLISSDKIYLVLIQAISGFAWAGFNLATSNFIFDAVSEEKRVRCIAYFNLLNGLGVFFGSILGGWVAARLPFLLGSQLLTLFLVSGILRIVVRSFFLPKLHEVKPVEKITNTTLFVTVTGIKPLLGMVQNVLHIE